MDSSDNATLPDDLEPSNTPDIQLDNNIIMQPKGSNMETRENLQLLLNEITEPVHEAHQASVIMNNPLSASILVYTGSEVFLYGTVVDISYNVGVIIRGWQDIPMYLWHMSLLPYWSNSSITSNKKSYMRQAQQRCQPSLLTAFSNVTAQTN